MTFHRQILIASSAIGFLTLTACSTAQLRYANSLSLSGGAYAASGIGTNHYLGIRYNYFLFGGRYFVEGSFGVSSLRSAVLETVSKAQLFASERLQTYEFVLAYDAFPSSHVPFVVVGVAGINQGGQSNFAGVIGLGKRVPFGASQMGFRYDVRDQIFSQKINNGEAFLSHNLVVSVGLQFYF